jgi:hypothetical protein
MSVFAIRLENILSGVDTSLTVNPCTCLYTFYGLLDLKK